MRWTWQRASEYGMRRDDQPQTLWTLRDFDAQRRGEGSVETETEAVVALQSVEIEVRAARGDFPRVVEDRRVHEAVGHDAPLRLQRQTVLVAEAVAGEASQRRSASHVRQHEE